MRRGRRPRAEVENQQPEQEEEIVSRPTSPTPTSPRSPPHQTMAEEDNRPLKQYATPTARGLQSGIARPNLTAEHFTIPPHLLFSSFNSSLTL